MNTLQKYVHENRGFSLGFAVPMAMLILFSSLAYLKWQVSEQETAHHQVAVTQAYYVAQAAVIAKPLSFMRNQGPNFFLTADIPFADGAIAGMGSYLRPLISYVTRGGVQAGQLYQNRDYLLSATGIVTYQDFTGHTREVRRRAEMLIRKKEFSQYFYFTSHEQTMFGESIWFFSGDSVKGPVFSDEDIMVLPGTIFLGLVVTHKTIRSVGGSQFLGQPPPGYIQHAASIEMPARADLLRAAAASGGSWLDGDDYHYTYGLWFHGTAATMWRWETGSPSPFLNPDQTTGGLHWSVGTDYAIFVNNADLWCCGDYHGRIGLGTSGNMRLMDNLVYTQAMAYPYNVSLTNTDMATLVSEAPNPSSPGGSNWQANQIVYWNGIVIANTPQNGRDNGRYVYPVPESSQDHRDIAIHGQIFCTVCGLTFEQQNDTWCPYQGPTPDERGRIFLTGALAEGRRNYVHRGNHGGTGYLKSYSFDPRWDKTKTANVQFPPFQEDLTSSGHLKWDVLGWQDLPRHQGDERNE